MQTYQNTLRVLAAFVSLAFALLALAMPILGVMALYDEGGFIGPHADNWRLGLAGYAFTVLVFCIFSALVSVALFRYARYGGLHRRLVGSKL
jgi:uncharacterized membrane protein YiaA